MKDPILGIPAKPCFFQHASHQLTQMLFRDISKSKTSLSEKLQSIPLGDGYEVLYSQKIDHFSHFFPFLEDINNMFLQPAYLKLLQDNPPKGMKFGYLIFQKDKQTVGFASCQFINFNLRETLFSDEVTKGGFWSTLKNNIANRFNFQLLVCGTATVTGQHGFHFQPQIPVVDIPNLIVKALSQLVSKIETKVDTIMIKDLGSDNHVWQESWDKHSFSQVTFQPNMIFDLEPSWTSIDDYLEAMTSKYRVRVKRARKKAKMISKRPLELNEIQWRDDKIHQLYLDIAQKADFNLATLNVDYLPALKAGLGNNFTLTGYFMGEEMLGFCTTIRNGEELEAHFLGVDQDANFEYQLYLNMLYDMVEQGIQQEGITRIVFGRTAPEIKSSVGAVAQQAFCYFRHRNRLINSLVPMLIRLFEPKIEWTPRHPFGH